MSNINTDTSRYGFNWVQFPGHVVASAREANISCPTTLSSGSFQCLNTGNKISDQKYTNVSCAIKNYLILSFLFLGCKRVYVTDFEVGTWLIIGVGWPQPLAGVCSLNRSVAAVVSEPRSRDRVTWVPALVTGNSISEISDCYAALSHPHKHGLIYDISFAAETQFLICHWWNKHRLLSDFIKSI